MMPSMVHSKTQPHRAMKQKSFGFTLIEILLVVSLMAMVGLSIYSAFANGLKVWDRGKNLNAQEDIMIFFDRIGAELRNSFRFSKVPFYGRSQRVVFPTMVKVLPDPKMNPEENSYISQIGKVEYEFDVVKDQLIRREASYGQAIQGRFSEKGAALRGIRNIEFKYYFPDEHGELFSTQIIDDLPAAVTIEVEYFDQGGEVQKVIKTINIPLGFSEETEDESS
ncbi:MAG: hypothetical protein A2787_01955 [Omnitrophica WOR_2 bacterium RIFCSPHIGHO2_01_FULL_48_9]|nr:MAG: hypothetical protein A3D10_06790 [Omnitrophica WOR_2 bacterium RIFCSPHIGHO2_02_FULL_48_11]OGX34483.1 MAG: hypothetical protein A2787_01955 [Omnitrophica WOR_2 bacterium RIFCSPHIGHO2_01_FULL_48_9]